MTVCVLGGIGLFHLSCQMCVELFLVLPYFPFDLCRVCMKIQFHSISWNLNFTPDIDNSSLLSFFLCLPNLVILLIFFKESALCFIDFFLLFFCFQFYWFLFLSSLFLLLLCSKKKLFMISIFNSLRLVLWPRIQSIIIYQAKCIPRCTYTKIYSVRVWKDCVILLLLGGVF